MHTAVAAAALLLLASPAARAGAPGAGSPMPCRMLGLQPGEGGAALRPTLVSVSCATGTETLIGALDPRVLAPIAGLAAVRRDAAGGGAVVHYVAISGTSTSSSFELRGARAGDASEAHPPVPIPLPVDNTFLGLGMYLQLDPATGDVYVQGFVWANSTETEPLRVPRAGGPPSPRVAVVQTVRIAPFAGTVTPLGTFGAGWAHGLVEGGASFWDAAGGRIWAQFARPAPTRCPFDVQHGVRWAKKGKKPEAGCPDTKHNHTGCTDATSCCAACEEMVSKSEHCAAWHFDPKIGCHIFPTPPSKDPVPCDNCSAGLSHAEPGHGPPLPPAACMNDPAIQFVLVPIDPRTGTAGEPVPDLLCGISYKYDAATGTAAAVGMGNVTGVDVRAKYVGTFDPASAGFAAVARLDPAQYGTIRGYNFGALDSASSRFYFHAAPLLDGSGAMHQVTVDMRSGAVTGDVPVCAELDKCVAFLGM